MISIIDSGSSYSNLGFGSVGNTVIDRAIYLRLQRVPYSPLGSEEADSIHPISTYIASMEKFYTEPATNTAVEQEVNKFFGSLAITQYYPHPDNFYKGELA